MVKILSNPISGQVILTQKTHFRRTSWPNLIHIKITLKHQNQRKKNWKIIFGSENRGETSFFISRHFDQTMTILILHFLCFGALKELFWDKNKQNDIFTTKTWGVLFVPVSLQHFSHSMFSPFICIGWRTNGVWIKLHKWFK